MELYTKLSALQYQNSIKWAQRSRLHWIHDGDRNSKFFHSITRSRSLSNYISQIEDSDGFVHSDPASIETTFLNYFQNLSKAPLESNRHIVDDLPPDIPRLSDSDHHLLVQDVTMDEVYATLIDLHLGKSPGPDGINVEFYRNFWPMVGDRLFNAIQFFF